MSDKKQKRRVSFEEAREQAADYFNFAASVIIETAGGKSFEIPNPGLMDDDQQERYDALQARVDGFDKEDVEIPIIEFADVEYDEKAAADTASDADVKGEDKGGRKKAAREPRLLGFRKEKQLVTPYKKDGEPAGISYNIELAKAIFGDQYEAFKAAGGRSSLIALEWARMNRDMQKRETEDPK